MKNIHVYTWWAVASFLAIAIARSHNPLFALAIVLAASFAVHFWARESAWRKSFRFSLQIALFVIAFRIGASVLIGIPIAGKTLFTLPTLTLPRWMAGATIGGAITQERLSGALGSAIVLASIIAIMGAAQSLTSPQRFLRSLPRIFYEFGLVLVIATTLIPNLFASVAKIREAHFLRGISPRGVKSFATPLIEESLERTLALATSMEQRGYGLSLPRTRYFSEHIPRENFSYKDCVLLFFSLSMALFL